MKACVQPDYKSSVCECSLAEQEAEMAMRRDMAMQGDATVLRHFRLCVQASIAVV